MIHCCDFLIENNMEQVVIWRGVHIKMYNPLGGDFMCTLLDAYDYSHCCSHLACSLILSRKIHARQMLSCHAPRIALNFAGVWTPRLALWGRCLRRKFSTVCLLRASSTCQHRFSDAETCWLRSAGMHSYTNLDLWFIVVTLSHWKQHGTSRDMARSTYKNV